MYRGWLGHTLWTSSHPLQYYWDGWHRGKRVPTEENLIMATKTLIYESYYFVSDRSHTLFYHKKLPRWFRNHSFTYAIYWSLDHLDILLSLFCQQSFQILNFWILRRNWVQQAACKWHHWCETWNYKKLFYRIFSGGAIYNRSPILDM